VRLTTSLNPAEFDRDDYDLAIEVLAENIRWPDELAGHNLLHSGPCRSGHPFRTVGPDSKARDDRLIAFREWLLEERR
jgi:hypothetical protein